MESALFAHPTNGRSRDTEQVNGEPRGSEAEVISPEEYSSASWLSMVKENSTARSSGHRSRHGRHFPGRRDFLTAPGGALASLVDQASAGIAPSPQERVAPIRLGLRIGTNQSGFLGGFLYLSDAESMNFHCVPNQVLYQAEPRPDKVD